MVPSPPEVIQRFGCSKPKYCAAHIWCWPTSVVMKVSRPRLAGDLVQPLHRVLRLDDAARPGRIAGSASRARTRSAATSRPSPRGPAAALSSFQASISAASTRAASPTIGTSTLTFLLIEDGSMSAWIFFEPGREGVQPAGHAVVEAGADVQHDVAAMHRQVRLEGPVHPEHAEELRIRRRIGAEPHQRVGAGHAGHADELAQQPRGLRAGIDHAAAGIDDRALRALQQLHRGADRRRRPARSAAGSCDARSSAPRNTAPCRSGCPSAGRSPPGRAGRTSPRRRPRAPSRPAC